MIASFSVRGFRGLSGRTYTFGASNALIGPNGSGKTHILEAIHIASGGSLSTPQAPRKEDAFFEISVSGDIGLTSYIMSRHEKKEQYMIQGKKTTGINYRSGLPYRSVYVSPFDMNLLYFSPSMRRDFLDSLLERSFAQFKQTRREYDLIVRQRNSFLKKIRNGEATRSGLDHWNTLFADRAFLYHTYRERLLSYIASRSELWKHVLRESIEFTTEIRLSTLEIVSQESIVAFLKDTEEKDILSGVTHIGPHLDDFGFQVHTGDESISTALYLSRGENKMLLFVLKQIEIEFLRKYTHLPILLLFDDIFSELDYEHGEAILETLHPDQIIISTPRSMEKEGKWHYFTCINLDPA